MLLPALAVLLEGQSRAAQDWPEFRGPTGQGLSSATNVPIRWSATSNVVWKSEVPGLGWASPVLAANRLYLTTAVETPGASPSLRALCLDATIGQITWDVEVFRADPATARQLNSKNSLASPTPIVRGDRLYVHFGHLGTAALDSSGRVLWRQTGLQYPPVHGNGSTPVLVDNLLVFDCDGQRDPFVAALDAQTGEVRWRTPRRTPARSQFSFSTPLVIQVDGTAQIISPGSGYVGAYNPADGRLLWQVNYGEGYSVVPRPVFALGLLFLSSGFDNPALYAIRPQGAHGDVTTSHVVWRATRSAPLTPSPLVVGKNLYYVSDTGVATCADAHTGAVYWSERLGGGFSASPVFAEGRLYFQNETGAGFVVREAHTFTLLARNDLGERTLASYAVTDNALFIRSRAHLWKIGERTPRQAGP